MFFYKKKYKVYAKGGKTKQNRCTMSKPKPYEYITVKYRKIFGLWFFFLHKLTPYGPLIHTVTQIILEFGLKFAKILEKVPASACPRQAE
jgi:hypothetical protein